MLSESIRCIPLHSPCTLVGVPLTGCLRVALFVTKRYLWSFRPLTSHFLPAPFVLIASCAHVQYHRLPPGLAQLHALSGVHTKTVCVCRRRGLRQGVRWRGELEVGPMREGCSPSPDDVSNRQSAYAVQHSCVDSGGTASLRLVQTSSSPSGSNICSTVLRTQTCPFFLCEFKVDGIWLLSCIASRGAEP